MEFERHGLAIQLENLVQEAHGKPLYSVKFNDVSEALYDCFATVGANQVTVYRTGANAQSAFELDCLCSFTDQDREEMFYSCAWTETPAYEPLLCVAGYRGIVKIINLATHTLDNVLMGHGNAINDIKVGAERRATHVHLKNVWLTGAPCG
jgi:polycomb protein EED